MHKYHIWDSWSLEVDGWTNDDPEVYEASSTQDAVEQYIKNHIEDGVSDNLTIWVSQEADRCPQMVYVHWRYELVVDIECAS
jgi:hypothetical protein